MKKIYKFITILFLLNLLFFQARFIFGQDNPDQNPALNKNSQYQSLDYKERKVFTPPSFFSLLADELPQGINHIATGLDHIAFIIAIALILTRLKSLIWVITFFTIAHAITLTLYSLNIISIGKMGVSIIEILVSFSILWVGVENIWLIQRKSKDIKENELISINVKKRATIAFVFGLVHGIAFSEHFRSAMVEYDYSNFVHVVKLLFAILSFNIGVDLGQLAIAFFIFFVFWAMKKYIQPVSFSNLLQKKVILYTSILIAILGAGWLVQRISTLRF